MEFKEAFELMKDGQKVKLPSWAGYWCWENDTIMMYCKDGKVLDIRETETVDYTFANITSDKWIIATPDNTPILGGIATFDFDEAIKYLNRGLKVTRKEWNGKGVLTLIKITAHISFGEITYGHSPYIQLETNDDEIGPWLPRLEDYGADDYIFADDIKIEVEQNADRK